MVEPAPAAAPRLLHLQGCKVARAQGGSRFELEIPEFEVTPGAFVAVTGESGCGKSTLLDLLALVLRPEPGGRFLLLDGDEEVDVDALWAEDDEQALARLRRRRLGYVPQSGGLIPFLGVAANLYLPPRLNGQRDYRGRIHAQAERMGVAGLFDRMPASLSGGQRQRVAILRAMAHRPALILADEPTAAVDSERAHRILAQFHDLAREEGTAIVMVTHDRSLVAQGVDRHYGFEVDASDERHVRSRCVRRA